MQPDKPELKEALLYTKVSLLNVVICLPFALTGYILRHSSSFAVEMMSLGVVGALFSTATLIIFYRKWKRLASENH